MLRLLSSTPAGGNKGVAADARGRPCEHPQEQKGGFCLGFLPTCWRIFAGNCDGSRFNSGGCVPGAGAGKQQRCY